MSTFHQIIQGFQVYGKWESRGFGEQKKITCKWSFGTISSIFCWNFFSFKSISIKIHIIVTFAELAQILLQIYFQSLQAWFNWTLRRRRSGKPFEWIQIHWGPTSDWCKCHKLEIFKVIWSKTTIFIGISKLIKMFH